MPAEPIAEQVAGEDPAMAANSAQANTLATPRPPGTRCSQAWSAELARYAIARNADNRKVIEAWVATWQPLAEGAVSGLATAFGEASQAPDVDAVLRRVKTSVDKLAESWSG